MLCIGTMGGGQHRYYTSIAETSYYTAGGEPPGRWLGGTARHLKLWGQVKPEQLQELFKGFDPNTGQPLVQNAGQMQKRGGEKGRKNCDGSDARKPGWDWCFHIPKSLSCLWAMADQETQKTIQQAAMSALKETLGLLEQEATWCARGKGGWEHVPAKLIAAVFPHGTSRAMDPDYHLHCLILNTGLCEDGKTRALVSSYLYNWSPVASRYFRVALEEQLRERLGIDAVRQENAKGVKQPVWEVAGIPNGLSKLFSKRRQQIEERMADKHLNSPAAATVSAIDTRSAKGTVPPRKELFKKWRQEALDAGHSLGWVGEAIGRKQHTVDEPKVYRKAMNTALARLTLGKSHFSRRDLLKTVLEESMGHGLRARFVRQQVDRDLKRDPRFVNLGIRNGHQRFTTQAILQMEKRMLGNVEQLHRANYKPAPEKTVDRAIRKAKMDGRKVILNEEQQKAVRHLTQSPGRIQLVTGLAGTGKTTMLRVANDVFKKTGHELHGVAVAGVAAKKLQDESGIPSDTLAMMLKRLQPTRTDLLTHHAVQLTRAARNKPTHKFPKLKLHDKSVVVLDESSMVGTRDFMLLTDAVAKANAKLVCLGDHRQLPAIEAGGAFGSLIKRYGATDMQQIRRQRNPVDRERVKKLSRGEAEEVVKEIAREGNLHVAKDREQAEQKMVDDWARHGGTQSPNEHLMFAATNEEIDRLNTMAQQRRLAEGEIDERRSIKVGDESLYRSDRVLITKKDRKLGLENGDQGEIVAIRSNTLREQIAIRLDGEKKPRIVPVRTLFDRQFEHLRLGYATSVHKAQGQSVTNSYCLVGGRMTDREMGYVQASRHRERLSLYADENECGVALTNLAREATGEGRQLKQRQGIDKEQSPLIQQMSKSNAEELAHDVMEPPQPQRELTLEIERE